MRTQNEIVEYFENKRESDLLGFETDILLQFLDYEHAKPYLEEDATAEDWGESLTDPIQAMQDYMRFAWEKANNCRGISANRSIGHCMSWLWLAEEKDLLKRVEDEYKNNYQHYGKEILAHICESFGWDWKQYDNGRRVNSEDE